MNTPTARPRKEIEVKPAPGLMVPDPANEGADLAADKWTRVPHNRYWSRRLAQGDVMRREQTPPAAKTAVKPADKPTNKKD